jgi:Transglutaminase-like superfamily
MHKAIKALRLPWAQKRLLIETLVLLALARLAVLLLPFRWVARSLGKEAAHAPEHDNPAHIQQIRRIAAMVRKTSRHVPWTSKCLDQAIVAKVMLTRRGIPATVYFGVRNDENGQLAAHAWSRSGSWYVTGGEIRDQFTIINTFA